MPRSSPSDVYTHSFSIIDPVSSVFGATGDKKAMRLVTSQILDEGIAYITYRVVRDE